MTRMTIEIDRKLLLEVKRLTDAKTLRETVTFALQVAVDHPSALVLKKSKAEN
jgi:Arc/MetJ family transcription regulator